MSHFNSNNSNNNLSIINFPNSNHPKFLKSNPTKQTDSLSSNLISGLKSMTRLENFGKNLMTSKDKNLESNESSRRTSRTSISLVLVENLNIEKEQLLLKPSKNELPKDTKSDSDIDLESNGSDKSSQNHSINENNIINENKTFSMSSFNSGGEERGEFDNNGSNISINSGCYVSYKSASEELDNISKSMPYSATPKPKVNIPKTTHLSASNSSSSLVIKKVYQNDKPKYNYSNSSIYNQLATPIISQNKIKCNSLHYENESFNITENDKNYNLKNKNDKNKNKNIYKKGKNLEYKHKDHNRRRSNSSRTASQHMSPSSSTSKDEENFKNAVKYNYNKVGKLKRLDDVLLVGSNRSKSNIVHSKTPKRPDKLNLSVQANSTSKITVVRASASKSNDVLVSNFSKRSAFSTKMLAFDSNTMTHVPSENIEVLIEKDQDKIEKIIVLKNQHEKFNESFNNEKSYDKNNITPTDKSKHWASHKRNDSKNSNKSALSKLSGQSLNEGLNSASATMEISDRPLVYYLEKPQEEEQAKRRKVFIIFFFVLFIITVIVIAFLFLLARG